MNNKLQFTSHERRATRDEFPIGSALIIAVILTSLLAIIGVMFVMIARVDKMATSAISENKELNFAVEAVVAKISQELVLDVPGVAGAEYYDYPDTNNAWLASLEPYEKTAGNYYWRQISDVTEFLNDKGFSTQDVNVKPVGLITTVYVREYPVIRVDSDGRFLDDKTGNIATDGVSADADGDGIADSKWIKLDNITSNKGKPIYAAIRIVDNGGMINVNTARQFDPNGAEKEIDGSNQTQINLLALSERGSTSNPLGKLDDARFGDEPLPHNLDNYIRDVVWRYNEPNGRYTPFDISDELELRNRFTLNRTDVDSRIEEVWDSAFQGPGYLSVPVSSSSSFSDWCEEVYYDLSEPNATENYSYRHIGTTYNMDRIIGPDCNKMTNINDANVNELYSSIRKGLLDANYPDVNVAAQIAVNITDYRDSDSDVTVYPNPDDGKDYYGFERPCVYISELAYRFKTEPTPGGTGPGPPPPSPYTTYRSYAIELHKPYTEDNYPEPNQWRLDIQGYGTVDVNWLGTKHFHVIHFEDPCVPLNINLDAGDADSNLPFSFLTIPINNTITVFTSGGTISLQRKIGTDWITVDSVDVPGWLVDVPSGQVNPETIRSRQRDITLHKCIRRLWASVARSDDAELGRGNSFVDLAAPEVIQAHPENKLFTNVGGIGMVFRKSAYSQGPYPIEPNDTEATARLNLADPNFQQLFKYLTVFDPAVYSWNDPNETRIKGRININTAPWFVIAQLPWMRPEIAQVVVSHRDTPGVDGFKNIGALMQVGEMGYYANDTNDLTGFPDLTPSDGAANDFEERDVIFARISNLVTVRSDVFTAYILVRIGTDGPQKRVIAILDRSNVYSPTDKVRIVALHPVPDPR